MPTVASRARASSVGGLTLIELMVAMTIFLLLGGGLVMFLRVGIDTWRVGETRREAFERAGAILETLADDLRCTFSDPSHGAGNVVDLSYQRVEHDVMGLVTADAQRTHIYNVISLQATVSVPAGTFDSCAEISRERVRPAASVKAAAPNFVRRRG